MRTRLDLACTGLWLTLSGCLPSRFTDLAPEAAHDASAEQDSAQSSAPEEGATEGGPPQAEDHGQDAGYGPADSSAATSESGPPGAAPQTCTTRSLHAGRAAVAAVRDRWTLPASVRITTRYDARSGPLGPRVLWLFADVTTNPPPRDGYHPRRTSSALGSATDVLELSEQLDSDGVPTEFLPLSSDELTPRATREGGAVTEPSFWPGSIVPISADTSLVFYEASRRVNIFEGYERVGVGVATVTLGPTNQVTVQRDQSIPVPGAAAGALFKAPDEPSFMNGLRVDEAGEPRLYLYACHPLEGVDTDPTLVAIAPCRVAAAPLASARDRRAYTFWNGTHWVADVRGAQPILNGSRNMSVSFNAYLGSYLAVFSAPFTSPVQLFTAPRPEGPWTKLGQFDGAGDWNIDAQEHPAFARDCGRTVVLSYHDPGTSMTHIVEVDFD